MSWAQVLTPTPTVACTPGWCLKYVSDAFGVTNIPHTNYDSATDAWNASQQHRELPVPAGVWVPVWFSLRDEPNGHVALLAPDGSVWSSSDPNTNEPHHHASLDALIAYYANANPLTFLGWSPDIGGTPVITEVAMIPDTDHLNAIFNVFEQRNATADEITTWVGKKSYTELLDTLRSQQAYKDTLTVLSVGNVAVKDNWQGQIGTLQAQLITEKSKSAGLAKNLDDSQLELKEARDQLAQAESIANDDDAKIKDLTAQLAAANSKLVALAEKPPAPSTSTSTSTPPYTAPQPQPTQTTWLDSLLRYLRLK